MNNEASGDASVDYSRQEIIVNHQTQEETKESDNIQKESVTLSTTKPSISQATAESSVLTSVEMNERKKKCYDLIHESGREEFIQKLVEDQRKRFEESEPDEDSSSTELVIDTTCTKKRKRKQIRPKDVKKKKPTSDEEEDVPAEFLNDIMTSMEEMITTKARESNLSIPNVKTLIRSVFSNEHVISMARNTIRDDIPGGSNSEAEPAVYEPKLTRARTKELLEKQATVPWPITPVKVVPPSESQVLIGREYSEDSSDEEYVPVKEASEHSDDDDTASHFSTPQSSIINITDHRQELTPNTPSEAGFKVPALGITGRKLDFDAVEEVENIGQRTRSKLPLTDTSLETIEMAFMPPDITSDMYDCDHVDDDYANFLKEYYLSSGCSNINITDVIDDDEADPEYNVMEDEDVADKEELRMDRAVKVTKKELNDLLSELMEYTFGEEGLNTQEVQQKTEVHSEGEETVEETTSDPLAVTSEDSTDEKCYEPKYEFTKEQHEQLSHQMRQHVQLLTQHFLLSYSRPGMHLQSLVSKMLLHETSRFSGGMGNESVFAAENLPAAVDICNEWEKTCNGRNLWNETEHKLSRKKKIYKPKNTSDEGIAENRLPEILQKKKPKKPMKQEIELIVPDIVDNKWYYCTTTFPNQLVQLVSKSKAFVYPELLPPCPFGRSNGSKLPFLRSEDQLIAMGLEQFLHMTSECTTVGKKTSKIAAITAAANLISTHMLPSRTEQRIYLHIKKLRSQKDNPISYYFTHNKAPSFVGSIPYFDVRNIKPLCNLQPGRLPMPWRQLIFPKHKLIRKIVLKPKETPHVTPARRYTKILPAVQVTTLIPSTVISSPLKITTISTPLPTPLIVTSTVSTSNISPIIPIISVTPPSLTTTATKTILSMPFLITPLKDLSATSTISSPGTVGATEVHGSSVNSTGKSPQKHDSISTDQVKSCSNQAVDKKSIQSKSPYYIQVISKILTKYKHIDQVRKKKFVSKKERIKPSVRCKSSSDGGAASKGDNTKPVDINEHPQSPKPDDVEELLSPFASAATASSEEGNDTEDDDHAEQDKESDLEALMLASSTIRRPRIRTSSTGKSKKVKKDVNLEECVPLFKPLSKEEEIAARNENAAMYFKKVKDCLEIKEPETYQQFLDALDSMHHVKENQPVIMYGKISDIFKNHKDLVDEFVIFLTPQEALSVGKYVQYILFHRTKDFLRKAQLFFKDKPSQMQKIMKALASIKTVGTKTMKSKVLNLLKGNSVLIDSLNLMFLEDQPPESLMTDFEEMDYPESDKSDKSESSSNCYETITNIPEEPDHYGGKNCTCQCHNSKNIHFQNREKHCVPCGTKFIDGRVYVQTGKNLCPAKIMYWQNKQLSPVDNPQCTSPLYADNHQRSPDQEKRKFYRKSSPTGSSPLRGSKGKKVKSSENIKNYTVSVMPSEKEEVLLRPVINETETETSSDSDTPNDPTFPCNTPSSSHASTSTGFVTKQSDENKSSVKSWCKEENEVIFLTLKENGTNEAAFKKIAELLPNRSIDEIRDRVNHLIIVFTKLEAENRLPVKSTNVTTLN